MITAFAAEQQRQFDATTSPKVRKEQGHFGTPTVIADYMAGMFSRIPSPVARVLDAGAGVGTLSAAVCQRLLQETEQRFVQIDLWETDLTLAPLLRRTMEHCQTALNDAGHLLEYTIRGDDFILSNAGMSLFENRSQPKFHLAILNPPYYKVRKESAQSRAMQHVVHGQPNIYAFFMAAASDLLVPGGEMVAITPRSYFSGPYFKQFRNWFFDRMIARRIHLFESRTEAFTSDNVLQENVILLAEKGGDANEILLSSSNGLDLENCSQLRVPYRSVIDNSNGDRVVRISTSKLDRELIAFIERLPRRFRDSDYAVSTGPVVAFRATEFLRHDRADDTAPLLWLHNVCPLVTQHLQKKNKPAHIRVCKASRSLLLQSSRYVLLRRFASKEEKKRLVAGVFEPSDSYSEWVGLENHLNYVYRKNADLTTSEAYGLACYFNSTLVDRYIRAISGNTQVNATEIRDLPMPDELSLMQIGDEYLRVASEGRAEVDRMVARVLDLPMELVERVDEARL